MKFHFIHPSVNIQRDIVDKFLVKFGQVKSWHATIDPLFKLLTGQYVFMMFEDDLKRNPLPMTIYINGVPCTISYRTRVKTCFKCGEEGHFKSGCPKKVENDQKCWQCGKEGHIKRNFPGDLKGSEGTQEMPGLEPSQDPSLPSAGAETSVFMDGVLPENRSNFTPPSIDKPSSTKMVPITERFPEVLVPPAESEHTKEEKSDESRYVTSDQEDNEGESKDGGVDDDVVTVVADGDVREKEDVLIDEEEKKDDFVDEEDVEEVDDDMDVDEKKIVRKRALKLNTGSVQNKQTKLHGKKGHSRPTIFSNIKPGSQVVRHKLPNNGNSTEFMKGLLESSLSKSWADAADVLMQSTHVVSDDPVGAAESVHT